MIDPDDDAHYHASVAGVVDAAVADVADDVTDDDGRHDETYAEEEEEEEDIDGGYYGVKVNGGYG